MISPCNVNLKKNISHISLIFEYSLNVTVPNSPGLVRRDDPVYTHLPPDSRKPPALIDNSGMIFKPTPLDLANFYVYSFQMVLHLVGSGINRKSANTRKTIKTSHLS